MAKQIKERGVGADPAGVLQEGAQQLLCAVFSPASL